MTNAVYSIVSSSSENVGSTNSYSTSSLLRVFHMFLCAIMIMVALFGPAALQKSLKIAHPQWFARESSDMKIVTLAFNQTGQADARMIAHNCAMLSRSNNDYFIHIDNTSHPFCARCKCVRFIPIRCSCPDPISYNCALCEKLLFVIHALKEYKEIVFLDSDLILLREDFMERLRARTNHFDFLAAYGFDNPCRKRYRTPFNSGLMFMRAIPRVNYSNMVQMMWDMSNNNDQNVISRFVQQQYSNWDTLSLRWHCRYLYKEGYDIPPEQCYAFHGRSTSLERFLERTNSSLLDTWD